MDSMDISAAGMRAQRVRMDLIATNLANVDTTSARTEIRRTPEGDSQVRHIPYRRQVALMLQGAGGAPVARVVEDRSDFRREQQPGHPHAEDGVVSYPNVNSMVEMVDMIAASRAYEANLTAVEVAKAMNQSALRILG
jgi:flagellar basal-body rod protein FlgC